MKMKDKSILMAIGAGCLVVLFLLILVFTDGKKETADSPSEENVSSSEVVDESQLENPETKSFEEIVFDTTPSMYGKTDYFTIQKGIDIKNLNSDYLQLEPLMDENGNPEKYYLGHQIYRSQTNGEDYIFSGNAILPVSFTADYEGNGYMREETTGKKIHLFGNTSDVETFLDNWDAGQRILSGKTEAEENSIIFDGALTPYKFVEKNGTLYFNLSEIAPLASSFTYYDETMGYIDVYVNDFCNVRVPTTAANPMMQKSLGVQGDNFKFLSWNGEEFEAWGPVLDAIDPEISIDDASMMFGWKMYTNGTALSIVTDPLNVTSLAAIRDKGNVGIKVVLEYGDDGQRYLCAYDSSGQQLWKKLFDESQVGVEDPEVTASTSQLDTEESSQSTPE